MIAKEWNSKLEYVWYPTRRGYFRILNGTYCDIAMEAPAGLDMAGATKPYFRSAYVFVARKGSGLEDINSLADPRLKKLKIGVNIYTSDAENSPPAMALSRYGVVGNLNGYITFFSDQDRPDDIIKGVANKDVDIAIAWGPLAGYYAKQSPVPLVLTPLPDKDSLSDMPVPVQHRASPSGAATRSSGTACRRCSIARRPEIRGDCSRTTAFRCTRRRRKRVQGRRARRQEPHAPPAAPRHRAQSARRRSRSSQRGHRGVELLLPAKGTRNAHDPRRRLPPGRPRRAGRFRCVARRQSSRGPGAPGPVPPGPSGHRHPGCVRRLEAVQSQLRPLPWRGRARHVVRAPPHRVAQARRSDQHQGAFIQTVCAGRPEKGMPSWCALGMEMGTIEEIYSYVKARSDAKMAPGRPAVKPAG